MGGDEAIPLSVHLVTRASLSYCCLTGVFPLCLRCPHAAFALIAI